MAVTSKEPAPVRSKEYPDFYEERNNGRVLYRSVETNPLTGNPNMTYDCIEKRGEAEPQKEMLPVQNAASSSFVEAHTRIDKIRSKVEACAAEAFSLLNYHKPTTKMVRELIESKPDVLILWCLMYSDSKTLWDHKRKIEKWFTRRPDGFFGDSTLINQAEVKDVRVGYIVSWLWSPEERARLQILIEPKYELSPIEKDLLESYLSDSPAPSVV